MTLPPRRCAICREWYQPAKAESTSCGHCKATGMTKVRAENLRREVDEILRLARLRHKGVIHHAA